MENKKTSLKPKSFCKLQNFLSNPYFKFKENITKKLYSNGIFEVFEPLKYKGVYLAFPNKNDYTLEIISLLNIKDCKSIFSLQGHQNFILLVKYFKNNIKNNDYLISSDKNNTIIIWDISKNFSEFVKIKNDFNIGGFISGVLLLFNIENILNEIDDYIIFSFNCQYYTNLNSIRQKDKKFINNTNEYNTYYLLYWLNKEDKNHYIIELSDNYIFIYNLKNDNLDKEFYIASSNNSKVNCGFIYNKDDTDYLIASSSFGLISIFDLTKKSLRHYFPIVKSADLHKDKFYLSYILPWSNRFFIACDYENKGFKIIDIGDLKKLKIVSFIKGKHFGGITYVKKFVHPFYGESLLTSDNDCTINIWTK